MTEEHWKHAIIPALAVKQTHASHTHWMDLHTAGASQQVPTRGGRIVISLSSTKHTFLGRIFCGMQTEILAFRWRWWRRRLVKQGGVQAEKPPSWSWKRQRPQFLLLGQSHTPIQVVTVESEMPCRPWHAQHRCGSINQLPLNHLLWRCF